jgi:hypothetical protein
MSAVIKVNQTNLLLSVSLRVESVKSIKPSFHSHRAGISSHLQTKYAFSMCINYLAK